MPMHFVDFFLAFIFPADAANTFRSSMYSRSVILAEIGLDSLQPSEALSCHATGIRHIVNSLGHNTHNASPCGRPLLNLINSDVSHSSFVVTTFQVA